MDRGIGPLDPSVPRRESNPMHQQSYYAPDRSQYYMGAAPSVNHPHYATQPLSTWTTTAPAQPQI